MRETEWVEQIARQLAAYAGLKKDKVEPEVGLKLPYGYEIRSYGGSDGSETIKYETDLVLVERGPGETWQPRVVIEAKINSINTHDAITYSQKAASHRAIHPYLRYGLMLGNRGRYPLPGRLYRHGQNFDFMISFAAFKPTTEEMKRFVKLLRAEVKASRAMERIVYESRKKGRDHFTVLHRALLLE